ncbi:DSBA-like thioredoxin domain-containing protein [Listeria floridensis FSL S10-1187]|uniref:DSBA-like thioredoxin domain-containing protein n=1 Tax=Listeria floridensis FSL S10-1187 TaxID=1265817 RepID=A0ABN0RH86_9LIST|nr:DsbA family oxidoreductase [Listeria floridensis]EUJ33175.1 DSBA-like thioredoxin domain-containing protein [Listeria floridensis FSL S10-1187]
MKIEIWSDFACPFCYIGKKNLEQAMNGREDVEVEFRSFELDPNAPVETDKSIHELLAEKYGKTVEEAKQMNAQVGQMAELAGLHYDFDNMKSTNTFTAHRIAQYARSVGKENEFMELGMDAYFAKGAFLNDEETLVELAKKAGLDETKVREIIHSNEYLAQVRVDETKAMEYGINSVPFFLIDGKYAVSGAQPVESFVSVLERAGGTKAEIKATQGPGCEDGSCSI